MNQTQIDQVTEQLQREKERLLKQISRLEETGLGDTASDSVGELSRYDNHPADLGSETFERGKDIALRDNETVLLNTIEKALDKLKNGTYGLCSQCGRPIPEERLAAVPWAVECIECQQDDERQAHSARPVEEESLAPPFHRSFLDTADFDFVGFDGEDALQAVLKYGSSDTPQDLPGTYDYSALFPNSNEHQGIVELSDAIPADSYRTENQDKNKKKHDL